MKMTFVETMNSKLKSILIELKNEYENSAKTYEDMGNDKSFSEEKTNHYRNLYYHSMTKIKVIEEVAERLGIEL